MKFLIVVYTLFFTTVSQGYSLFTIDELSLDYKNYSLVNPTNRFMLTYPDSAKEGLNLTLNTDILQGGYIDTVVEGITTSSQYRGVGLQLRLGIRPFSWLEIGFAHHSQHVLDENYTAMPSFPEDDSFEVKLILWQARPSRQSIW